MITLLILSMFLIPVPSEPIQLASLITLGVGGVDKTTGGAPATYFILDTGTTDKIMDTGTTDKIKDTGH